MTDVKEIDRGFKQKEYYGWRAVNYMAIDYIKQCRAATRDDSVFEHFKSMSGFRNILEHVPSDLGEKYLDDISKNNPELIQEAQIFIKANDTIGSPYKSDYVKYNIEEISPTTARYMKVLSDLMTLYNNLDDMNIVEIGGGYGGLTTVISKKFKFNNYYNVDLADPAKLAKKYCWLAGINNFHIITPDKLDKLNDVNIDLVISNYAFSECNYETQNIYIDKILSRSKRGYITHNTSDERRERTKSIIQNYNNFNIFGRDFCKKQHPIFAWGK